MSAVCNLRSTMIELQTRSIPETDQKTGGVDSKSKALRLNEDGSATAYFGPRPPKDKEGNWVQTMPGPGEPELVKLYSARTRSCRVSVNGTTRSRLAPSAQ